MADINEFYRAERRVLDPARSVAVGVRLLTAQRLELELARYRTEAKTAESAETDPATRAQKEHDRVRAAARSFPRNEDTLVRLARLVEPERSGAIAAHLLNFTGTIGERLRSNADVPRAIVELATGGALDDVLTRLFGLALDPALLTPGGFDKLITGFVAEAAGTPPDAAVLAAFAEFTGAAADGTKKAAAGTKSFGMEAEFSPRINWAMERNGVPILHEVRITNHTDAEITDLRFTARLTPDFSEPIELAIPPLPAHATQTISRPDLRLSGKRLREVVEKEKAVFEWTLSRPSGESFAESAEVEVLAFNEWNARALPELLAAFVLPNHAAVGKVLEAARDVLAAETGDPGLAGYMTKSIERVRTVARAVYVALQKREISYIAPPASFESAGQKIRLPDQVLEPRMGTCIDLTLVIAAALEQCGLNPLIVLEKGHAYLGLWLVDDTFGMPATVDHDALRKLVEVGDVLLLESTALTARPAVDFASAVASATARLADAEAFESVLDVRAARRAKILPLAIGGAQTTENADAGSSAPSSERGAPGAAAPQGPAGGPRAKGTDDPSMRRINEWIKRLLDLSMRNRLLAYRESRDKSVVIDCPDIAALEDRLAAGDWLTLEPKIEFEKDPRAAGHLAARGADEMLQKERRRLLDAKKIPTTLSAAELDRRLTLVARAARSEQEEKGISTLYLAVGMLKWFESADSERERKAPILLYPIEIERRSAGSAVKIRLRDDEPRLNDTLFEKLKQDFGLVFDDLHTLPEDEFGVDVPAVLLTIKRVVARVPRWDVLGESALDFFPFTKSIMVDDLRSRTEHLKKNDLFKILIGERNLADAAAFDGAFPPPEALDRLAPPTTSSLVVDADSSQHSAVVAALAGKSFVLQGPPGTGKSQTITNIIAAMIAAKKRVLFVAEKRAALEVVANRLTKIGLKDACLELHGKDVSKREVVLELARVLDAANAPAGAADPALAGRVDLAMRKLNGYVDAVHAPTPLGLSHFEVLGELCRLRDAPDLSLRFANVLATEKAVHIERIDALVDLEAAVTDVSPIAEFPFRSFRAGNWTPIRGREWQALFDEMKSAAEALERRAVVVKEKLALPVGGTIGGYEAHLAWLDVLAAGDPGGALALAARADRDAVLKKLDLLDDRIAEAQRLWAELDDRWEISLIDLDLDQLRGVYRQNADSFFAVRWFSLKGSNQELARAAKGPLGKAKDVLADLEKAHAFREKVRALDHEGPFLEATLGGAADGWRTDTDVTGRVLAAARLAIEAENVVKRIWPASTLLGREPLPAEEARALGDGLRADVAAARKIFEKMKTVFAFDIEREFAAPLAAVKPEALRERADLWRRSIALLQPWSRYLAAEDRVRAAGLGEFADLSRAGKIAARTFVATYERAFFREWAELSIESRPELADFDSKTHAQTIDRFKSDDVLWIAGGGGEIARSLAIERPKTTGIEAADSEVGIVQREAKKKTRHLPIRRLFEKAPNLMMRLKPCLLMSPLSIAQYLPPDGRLFDAVIFDEASQIATHDAVGAIARGKQVVIVGDSKQLPPTSFFATEFADDDQGLDDQRVDELESILDECVASQVPDMMLRWHYRSRDEGLITFSNHHYYENRLLTFPAGAGGPDFGVSLKTIEGVYDRAKSHTNRAEAEAVVAWILEALRDPARRVRSIGVVTFNVQQQTLIEDLLDQARRKEPALEPFFSENAPEPLFVKNLENVQGDERDVMLFSITYGPDAANKVLMNFGPLNKSGGERRLNVAITRAREQLVVFSTLRAERIELARTRALGAEHLKNFLRYAEEGPRALAALIKSSGGMAESPLEKEIADALRERGHKIDMQVGCSGYRIDLGVKDPGNPGRYLLGVECDGRAYHSAKTARERDRLRETVLRNLGWTIERVWSSDWWHDRAGVLARLEKAIEAAASRPLRPRAPGANEKVSVDDVVRAPQSPAIVPPSPQATAQTTPPPPAVPEVTPEKKAPAKKKPAKSDAPASPLGGEPYRVYETKRVGDLNRLMNEAETAAHMALMKEIIEFEGPIHRDLVFDRMARAFDIGRVTTRVEDRLAAIAARLLMAQAVRALDAFFWPNGADPAAFDRVREKAPDDDPRDLEHIPPEEMAVAVKRVLAINLGMPKDALVRSTVSVFGWKRLTPRAQTAVDRGIELLIARGGCRIDGDHLRIATE